MSGMLNVGRDRSSDSSIEEVVREIDRFVGMGNIKRELNKLIVYGQFLTLLRERDLAPASKIGLHMIFKGPPGTGKTELAREFGKLFKAIGLLRTSKVVERDRSTILGRALGDTESLMREAFAEAKNGVLFIDEAYALAGISDERSTEDRSDAYGRGAVATLLKLMEDNRSSVVVIVAGYTDLMERFLRSNTGLRSRFTMVLEFHGYKPPELLEIFEGFVKNWGCSIEPNALDEVQKYMTTWPIGDRDFGNGREVRTLFESTLPILAQRVSAIPGFRDLPSDQLLKITVADVKEAVEGNARRF